MKIKLPKKALVTGGAGFLGTHLCKRLLLDGYEVACLDNLYTGRKANVEQRPQETQARHHACQGAPRLGTEDFTRRGAC